MGRRGPQPKPKALLKLTGNYRAHRDASPDAPDVPLPECPAFIVGRARDYWPQVAAILGKMSLDREHFVYATALLVDTLTDWIEAHEMGAQTPKIIKGDKGVLKVSPVYKLKRDAWDRLWRALQGFGMSPSALRGIPDFDGHDGDAFDKWDAKTG